MLKKLEKDLIKIYLDKVNTYKHLATLITIN